jgi:hypothetical protein
MGGNEQRHGTAKYAKRAKALQGINWPQCVRRGFHYYPWLQIPAESGIFAAHI